MNDDAPDGLRRDLPVVPHATLTPAQLESKRRNAQVKNPATDRRVRHQHSKRGAPSPEYRVWASMVSRCENPSVRHYGRYGGRGIRIYPAWRLSFEAFLSDVGPRPSAQHTLDRIDGNGNYEPGNVRWATTKEQRDNCSNTVWITFRGETRTRADWARHLGLKYFTLRNRLDKGWSVEAALTTPTQSTGPWGKR